MGRTRVMQDGKGKTVIMKEENPRDRRESNQNIREKEGGKREIQEEIE